MTKSEINRLKALSARMRSEGYKSVSINTVDDWADALDALIAERDAVPRADLLAFGREESAKALARKDSSSYQFYRGWCTALELASG